MARGGYRPGAGGKPKWIHGKTKTIRVPEELANEIIRIARMLDEDKTIDDVTKSKYVDFSGISIRLCNGRLAIYLDDLLKAGYKVRPIALVDKIRKEADKRSK